MIGYGYTKSQLLIFIIGGRLSTVLYKVLIDAYGFYGAAWGQVFSFVIMALITVSFVSYQYLAPKYRINKYLQE